MRIRTKSLLALVALIVAFLAPASRIYAQGDEPIVVLNEAAVDFPDTVTFQLELEAGVTIADAQLTYQVGRDSCITAGTHVPVEADGSIVEWTWVMNRSGNPPPGAQMWWEWTITDSSGNVFTTEREALTFRDERFDWRMITSEGSGVSSPVSSPIVLYWYEGDDVGPVLLEAAESGLERLESDIGIELEGEVQIYVYEDAESMREALLFVQDWAGGLAFSDYNTILLGVPPHLAETWGSDTIRHELAHLVLGQFGRSCLGGNRPTWLEEGLATYAEGEPDEGVRNQIEQGIEDDSFQPVRSLNGAFPAHSEDANAAYSQSYSLVDFLLQTYGQEALQSLILDLAAAEGYDDALEGVYGFNADGLELAWRESIGAPSRQIPATPTPVVAASVPTVVPNNAARSVPTPSSAQPTRAIEDDSAVDEDAPSGLCGLSLAPTLLFGIGATLFFKKRRN
ncbi:MAG: peptidase MA family metallohydrolase [Candidatus Promineifilaceae bacterium]